MLVSYWTLLVLLAATAWRATHLITADDFPPIRAVRGWLARGPEWLGDLVTCAYCAGVWVAAAVVALADWVGSVPRPWFAFGFVAAAVPFLEAVVGRLEREPTVPTIAPASSTAPAVAPQPTTFTRTRER